MARLTWKQIKAGFGGKRAQSALRNKRSKSKAPKAPRKTRRVHHMARRRKSSRKGRKIMNVAKTLVAGNAIFQMVEPSVRAGLITAVQSGDVSAIIQALRTGAKEAVTMKNLSEALVPVLGYGIAKKVAQGLGIRSPRVGKVAAF